MRFLGKLWKHFEIWGTFGLEKDLFQKMTKDELASIGVEILDRIKVISIYKERIKIGEI